MSYPTSAPASSAGVPTPQRRANPGLWPRLRGAWLLALLATSLAAGAAVREVVDVALTVSDVDVAARFYTNVLRFSLESRTRSEHGEMDDLLGLTGSSLEQATLRLGNERLVLTRHFGQPGRPIPRDSRSLDHWFQHIAIVVTDMDRAYQLLRQARVKPISTGPQTLPDWNPNAGGIRAFYFRDPDDHVLELIWFPEDKRPVAWRASDGNPDRPLFLGIDHTAIVVADTDRSLRFYHESLGFSVAGTSENYGPEQEHLNQVFGARLRITTLRARGGPGVELLEYLTPPGGRPLPDDASPRDLLFWTTSVTVDDLQSPLARFRPHEFRLISRRLSDSVPSPRSGPGGQGVMVRDPDGHAVHLRLAGASPTRN